MKFTKEQLEAMALDIADSRRNSLGLISNQIGDAFNQDNLANAIGRAEANSLIDGRVIAAQRYARLVPVDTTTQASVGTALTKGFTDAVGIGRPHSGTGNDIPLAELMYGEQSIKVQAGSIGYQYSVPEMQAAARGGVPLSTDKPAAARLAYERHMYKVAMVGEPETGKKGLLNHDIPQVFAATSSWDTGNVDTIMNDLSNVIGMAFDNADMTGDTSTLPNTILLPSKRMRQLNTLRIGPNSETTVLQFIKQNNILTENGVAVTFEGLPELNTVGADNKERIVIYRRDPSALELILPKDLEFLAPQPKGLDVFVPGWYLYAGLWIKSPTSVMYLDGIGG